MNRLVVGFGLVVMLSALAFFSVVANDERLPVSAVNSAVPTAFWVFLVGAVIVVAGGLQGRRQ